jgi:peptidoglycan-associated lipoprotein
VIPPAAPKAPEAPVAVKESSTGGYEFANIYFDYDSSRITAKAKDTLKRHAEWLKKNKDYLVKIEGYCDQRGTENYNMSLGKKRAESAKKALVKMGVAAKRISTVSYGLGRPVCSDASEDCWAKNRRGVFVVTKK